MIWDTSSVSGNARYLASATINTASGKSETSPISYQIDIPVKIYPNPASHEITIEFGHPNSKGEIRIYTINGSEILKQEVSAMERIDISQLRDGFYFYEIITEGKILHVGRLIKR